MSDVFAKCPLPWSVTDSDIVDAKKKPVAVVAGVSTTIEEDSALELEVVRRVNSYSDLYEALQEVVRQWDESDMELAKLVETCRAVLKANGSPLSGGPQ